MSSHADRDVNEGFAFFNLRYCIAYFHRFIASIQELINPSKEEISPADEEYWKSKDNLHDTDYSLISDLLSIFGFLEKNQTNPAADPIEPTKPNLSK